MAKNNYVSVIGPALIQPLLGLVETLESIRPMPPNEVQTGERENGYSLSITVLSALLFESVLNRVAYVRQEEKENRKPSKYFKGALIGDYIQGQQER